MCCFMPRGSFPEQSVFVYWNVFFLGVKLAHYSEQTFYRSEGTGGAFPQYVFGYGMRVDLT